MCVIRGDPLHVCRNIFGGREVNKTLAPMKSVWWLGTSCKGLSKSRSRGTMREMIGRRRPRVQKQKQKQGKRRPGIRKRKPGIKSEEAEPCPCSSRRDCPFVIRYSSLSQAWPRIPAAVHSTTCLTTLRAISACSNIFKTLSS